MAENGIHSMERKRKRSIEGDCSMLSQPPKNRVSFSKQLTLSDANSGGAFSVPKECAETIFPRLDYAQDPPAKDIHVTDVDGEKWTFRYVYRGSPPRHLLTTNWSKFVEKKKLVAGRDTVVFSKLDSKKLGMDSEELGVDSEELGVNSEELCVEIRRSQAKSTSGEPTCSSLGQQPQAASTGTSNSNGLTNLGVDSEELCVEIRRSQAKSTSGEPTCSSLGQQPQAASTGTSNSNGLTNLGVDSEELCVEIRRSQAKATSGEPTCSSLGQQPQAASTGTSNSNGLTNLGVDSEELCVEIRRSQAKSTSGEPTCSSLGQQPQAASTGTSNSNGLTNRIRLFGQEYEQHGLTSTAEGQQDNHNGRHPN